MKSKETFMSYLRAAAYQRLLMDPWLKDRYFINKKRKIFYAVDSDIVKLYTDPEKLAIPSKKRKKGYAQIFPADENALSIAIGRALANHIFNRLDQDFPLFIIPPIETEIRDIYYAIARDAEKEIAKADTELQKIKEMKKTLAELGEVQDGESLLNRLKDVTPQVMKILSGEGHAAELRHFNKLLANTRIASPEYVLENELIKGEKVIQALSPVSDIARWINIYDLEQKWEEELKKTKSHLRDEDLIDRDVKAMARLEWMNINLVAENCRVVYITGDASLIEAAKEHRVELNNEEYNFAELYLRHPRAFLAERNILTISDSPDPDSGENQINPDSDENQFVQSLDTFLAKFGIESGNYLKELEKLLRMTDDELAKRIEPVWESRPDIIQEFHDEWKEYTSYLVVTYGANPTAEEVIGKDSNELKNNLEQLINRVEDKLTAKIRETWNSYFKAVTKAGYLLIENIEARQYHLHCAPFLVFNSWPDAQKLAKEIIYTPEPGTLQAELYEKKIEELTEKYHTEYPFYLVYALLYAQMNAWSIAANLSTIAISIVDTCQEIEISGREAYYFRAVALRHSARHIHDLDKIPDLLNKAEECLEIDRARRKNPDLYGGAIRFRAERMSLYLSYNLFRLFKGKEHPADIPNLEKLQSAIEHELEHLEEKGEDKDIKSYVERSLVTMLLLVLFLRWKKESIELNQDALRAYYTQLKENKEEVPSVSFIVEVILLLTEWQLSDDPKRREQLRKKIPKLLDTPSIKKYSLFPYDEKLYQFLREIAENPA